MGTTAERLKSKERRLLCASIVVLSRGKRRRAWREKSMMDKQRSWIAPADALCCRATFWIIGKNCEGRAESILLLHAEVELFTENTCSMKRKRRSKRKERRRTKRKRKRKATARGLGCIYRREDFSMSFTRFGTSLVPCQTSL